MSHYKIIHNEELLDQFIESMPEHTENELYYVCLFGRHKYDKSFPNTKDSGQLARFASKKSDLKEKIRRLESPLGSYTRDKVVASQECLAIYIGLNPRSLVKASKNLLVELAKRIAEGNTTFNPMSLATTEFHRAVDRKFFLDFDFDNVNPDDYRDKITLPEGSYRILKTRGGFHLIVELAKLKGIKSNWHGAITSLDNCDVRGSNTLTPIPGCTQGNFCPHFV